MEGERKKDNPGKTEKDSNKRHEEAAGRKKENESRRKGSERRKWMMNSRIRELNRREKKTSQTITGATAKRKIPRNSGRGEERRERRQNRNKNIGRARDCYELVAEPQKQGQAACWVAFPTRITRMRSAPRENAPAQWRVEDDLQCHCAQPTGQ